LTSFFFASLFAVLGNFFARHASSNEACTPDEIAEKNPTKK
jgi:hypothetical protein